MAYVVANMERSSAWQAQTDSFLRATNVTICGNDYTATSSQAIRNYFVPPNSVPGGDHRPVFLAINCVSNSPSHPQWQLIVKDFYNGGDTISFSSQIAQWQRTIDSVQAPPPRLTNVLRSTNTFQFTFPGQRGQTNRVEFTTNLISPSWTVVTNVSGTNAPITIRDTNALANPGRFYRVRRL